MKKILIWTIVLAALSYGGAKLYLHHEVGRSVDQAVGMASLFAEISYERVASTISGELTVEGIRVRLPQYRDEILIDRVGIDTPSFLSLLALSDLNTLQRNKMPDYLGVILEGVHVPVDADYFKDIHDFAMQARGVQDADFELDAAAECTGRYGFSPAMLGRLGYTEQNFSMRVAARNDDSQYSLEFRADIEDMWAAEGQVTLAGNMMSDLARGAAYRPKLSDLEVIYKDLSLKSRVQKLCAENGLTPEQTVAAQLETLMFYGESNGIVFDEYVIEPYREFLKDKSTIRFTAQPNSPITVSQIDLYKPSDVPALLNLSASVE